MSNSRHYFSLKGAAAEKVAHELAVGSFFTDWCYRNPNLTGGKELCDLLVVFDHIAIIWQIKDLKRHSDGRYNKNDVDKNIRQLSGAMRRLIDVKRPITLTNPRRGSEAFDPSTIKETYLISVLAGEGEDFFPLMESIQNKLVHVFTSGFMEIVLGELDTIDDFVRYIQAKEKLLQGLDQLMIMGGEEDLLAIYLLNKKTFGELARATSVLIDGSDWVMLQKRPDYQAKKKADEISYGWDSMIDRAHESGSPEYEQVAREMARPNRFERRFLAKVFYNAHIRAHKASGGNVFKRVLPFDDRTYCFLFTNIKSRDHRKAMLENLCYVARGKMPQNSRVIGIATEKEIRPTCTYDFCYMDMPEWTDANAAHVEEIQRNTGLLTNTTVREAHEEEYPHEGDSESPAGKWRR